MRKLILSLVALFLFTGFIQAQIGTQGTGVDQSTLGSVSPTSYPYTKISAQPGVVKICYTVPITLGKAASNYSNPFSIPPIYLGDSTKFIGIAWQSNDTCQLTIALQTKNYEYTGGSVTAGTWNTLATATALQASAGNDTLYQKYILPRGTIPSGNTDEVAGSYLGDIARLKVSFANATTVGNSGYLRVWVYLKK